jgi:lipid-binding SYLF domain-containing protein
MSTTAYVPPPPPPIPKRPTAVTTDSDKKGPTIWERTKGASNTAYERGLKPGFNKVYNVVDKLGAPVNRLSNKMGSEAFWPTTMDKESEKAARILRGFVKDGFYEQVDSDDAERVATRQERSGVTQEGVPKGKQRVVVKIPTKVIKNAVGLVIFTTMRTGWVLGGSGGSGVLVARHPETGEWSPPSGVQTQNLSVGFLIGVDIYDTVLVINTYKALEAFTKLRCTLGTEVGLAAGPVGIGGALDSEIAKRQAPIFSYVKSRGLYAGVALEGNLVIERTDENKKFYGYDITAQEILIGRVIAPPRDEYQVLMDTLRAAQGDDVDESLLPESGMAPSDFEIDDNADKGMSISTSSPKLTLIDFDRSNVRHS